MGTVVSHCTDGDLEANPVSLPRLHDEIRGDELPEGLGALILQMRNLHP